MDHHGRPLVWSSISTDITGMYMMHLVQTQVARAFFIPPQGQAHAAKRSCRDALMLSS